MATTFGTGDTVHRRDDPRADHHGTIEAFGWHHEPRIRWANGWLERVDRDDLVLVKRAPRIAAPIG